MIDINKSHLLVSGLHCGNGPLPILYKTMCFEFTTCEMSYNATLFWSLAIILKFIQCWLSSPVPGWKVGGKVLDFSAHSFFLFLRWSFALIA